MRSIVSNPISTAGLSRLPNHDSGVRIANPTNTLLVQNTDGVCYQALVQFGLFVASLYAHEPALHVSRNIDEFGAHFTSRSLKSCNFIDKGASDTWQWKTLRRVVVASHGLLDTFIGMALADKLVLPTPIYAGRVIYAVVLLVKVYMALNALVNTVDNCIQLVELRVEDYLKQLVVVGEELMVKDKYNALSRAFLVMVPLEEWFYKHRYMASPAMDGATVDEATQHRCDHGQQGTDNGASTETSRNNTIAWPIMQASDSSRFGLQTQALATSSLPSFLSMGDGGNDDWFWKDFLNTDLFDYPVEPQMDPEP